MTEMITWWLHENCLMNFYWKYSIQSLWLPNDCLKTFLWMNGNWFIDDCWQPGEITLDQQLLLQNKKNKISGGNWNNNYGPIMLPVAVCSLKIFGTFKTSGRCLKKFVKQIWSHSSVSKSIEFKFCVYCNDNTYYCFLQL